MALSFSSVQKAYEVFNILKKEHLPDLEIPSWPQDMMLWEEEKKSNPPTNIVIGWDRKFDDGWEDICFFVKNPSEELKARFEELAERVPNTSINKPYPKNKKLWVIGWF